MATKPLTDAELKAKLIAKAQVSQPSNTLFPTEIVPLPSKGLVYPKEHPLSSGTVEVKYMTAKEEDILTNQNLLKTGRALDTLYKALIVGNGQGEPVNIEDLTMGDRSAMMLAARILGYGADYEISVIHPTTGETFKHVVDLNELKPKEIDESIYNNSREFEFELPISKKVITFVLTTSVEQKKIDRDLAAQEKAGVRLKNTTTMLKHVLTSIDGEADKKVIHEFVDNHLLARDSLELRNYMLQVTPDYDLTVHIVNDKYAYDEEMNLPISVDFFWPRS